MTATAIERAEIHAASCRARRQGLACSTCSDLTERAQRAARQSAQAQDELIVRDGVVIWTRYAA
jgi:hypothetical protein